MKILHIVGGELTGGAARGAYWLSKGLQELDIESKIYTNSIETFGDENVISTTQSKKEKALSLFRSQLDPSLKIFYKNSIKRSDFSTGLWGQDFTRTKVYQEADIIHLHWICGGFINIKHLKKIKKPIVWTIRDMWPMTGGCHYADIFNCVNYKSGCGFCKVLGSNTKFDLSRFVLKRKVQNIPIKTKLVGISDWISEQAKNSSLFKKFDIRTIYNNVNSNDFFPVDKKIAKNILGINTNKKIVLANVVSNKGFYKGFDKFLAAAQKLDPKKYFLLFFGKSDRSFDSQILGFEYKNVNYAYDIIVLRLLYSSADVYVAPSTIDAFGKTIAESMACGTPVVCFDATGPKEIVTHKEDGFKAIPFDVNSLKNGIEWVINSPNYYELARNARKKIKENFDSILIARQYIKLYDEILSNG
ncbi:glycosyltransferase [Desulfocicer niacini]